MAGASKHYRVAKRQVAIKNEEGMFIPKDRKVCIVVIVLFIVLSSFIKGVVIGHLINRD